MVLAYEHDHLAAKVLHRAAPLIGVQLRGIENRGVFTPAPPLDAIERVHAEVEKKCPLQPHPIRLIGARQNLCRLLRDDGSGIAFTDHLLRGIGDGRRRGCAVLRESLFPGQRQEHKQTGRERFALLVGFVFHLIRITIVADFRPSASALRVILPASPAGRRRAKAWPW